MPPKESDRVQREIEELLGKLDNFVPEERLVSKIKKRRKEAAGPNAFERTWASLRKRFSRVTLGHVMLFGVVLLLAAQFVPGLFYGYDRWALLAGILITIGAFILSAMGWDSRRTIASGGTIEKRWRGQAITYSEPSRADRIRGWFRRGRH
jgi:pilus assembly protein TadC